MRQRRLHLAVSLLALSRFGFSLFALRQIDDKSDAFVSAFFEDRCPGQHGYAAAVFAKIFLLEWFVGPGIFKFSQGFCGAVA